MDFEETLENIESKINAPMVTAKFGDNWKEHAKKNYDYDTVLNIAFKQGRYALLLEEELKKHIG